MGIFFHNDKLLFSGGLPAMSANCCCSPPCPYDACSSVEGLTPSTVEWCAATIGCAQSYPHEVYFGVSGGGGLFVPADTYFDCGGVSYTARDNSTRCCRGGAPDWPISGIGGVTYRLYGASSGYHNTKSETASVTSKYAYMDIVVGSNFGSGATNCSCNENPDCSPKGKYGWTLKVNATNHAVKIWDHANGCRTNRPPDWTLAKGASMTFGTTCDPSSSGMKLWDSVQMHLRMNFEG